MISHQIETKLKALSLRYNKNSMLREGAGGGKKKILCLEI